MDGLPFIPGFRFNDITKNNYHLSSQFGWKNGYALPNEKTIGIGKAPLDVESALYNVTSDAISYNSTLTYGQSRDSQNAIVQPHFIMFDGKCLLFSGYTKQRELESSVETFRVRHVKITYYLVDDTISVMEPVIENAGYAQGCLLKRCHVPNPYRKNKTWHWSDFNNGVEVCFYGVTYKLCSCDSFTKQFLTSQGIVLSPEETVPDDPYMIVRRRHQQQEQQQHPKVTETLFGCRSVEDVKLKQFLEYDGKVLRFYTVWDDNGSEPAEWKFFVLLYFMADDRVEIYESKEIINNTACTENPFPLFLGKIKLPKDWSHLPSNFPSIYSEPGSKENQEYYQPKDLIIGNTIFVMGRRFLLYDCDLFTRNYFKTKLNIVQPEPIRVLEANNNDQSVYEKVIPPHTGIGDPDDTRQNCLSLLPKPPKTLDFVTYVLNASKKLRYKLKMVPVYEVDGLRDFVMEFCLGNDQMTITEVASKNSGFVRGRFMSSVRLRKPGTCVDEDQFYGTKDFALDAELHVRGSVFKIVELDLWTYNYMIENKDMFTEGAINGAKRFLESKGLLNRKQQDAFYQDSEITENKNEFKLPDEPLEDTIVINKMDPSNIL